MSCDNFEYDSTVVLLPEFQPSWESIPVSSYELRNLFPFENLLAVAYSEDDWCLLPDHLSLLMLDYSSKAVGVVNSFNSLVEATFDYSIESRKSDSSLYNPIVKMVTMTTMDL